MNKKSGLTLIEVVVAMFIMTTAIVILNGSWSGSFHAYRKSRNLTLIASLMKRKITELELQFKEQGLDVIPESESGDFGENFPNYSWHYRTQEIEFPDLSSVFIAQDDGANETTLLVVKQLTNHFSKSIKELELTIVWKHGEKSVEYPVVTYITRFTGISPLNLLGGG